MPTQLQRSRRSAFHRQQGRCYYCGLRMWLAGPPGPELLRCTAEHLLARSEGGGNDRRNIVAACWRCNHARHAGGRRPNPEIYRGEVQRLMRCNKWMPRSVLAWGKPQAEVAVDLSSNR